jgi:Tfp pilus assembly protein PilF
MKTEKISVLCLTVLALFATGLASANKPRYDFRTAPQSAELLNMQNFHLQQAQTKLDNDQAAYAWGDLAYLLCHIPNHHLALEKMSALAAQLNKHADMQRFFEIALTEFPDDAKVQELYAQFKASSTTQPASPRSQPDPR